MQRDQVHISPIISFLLEVAENGRLHVLLKIQWCDSTSDRLQVRQLFATC